eukprot:Colp12_sorted_trinity150504_noHs@16257
MSSQPNHPQLYGTIPPQQQFIGGQRVAYVNTSAPTGALPPHNANFIYTTTSSPAHQQHPAYNGSARNVIAPPSLPQYFQKGTMNYNPQAIHQTTAHQPYVQTSSSVGPNHTSQSAPVNYNPQQNLPAQKNYANPQPNVASGYAAVARQQPVAPPYNASIPQRNLMSPPLVATSTPNPAISAPARSKASTPPVVDLSNQSSRTTPKPAQRRSSQPQHRQSLDGGRSSAQPAVQPRPPQTIEPYLTLKPIDNDLDWPTIPSYNYENFARLLGLENAARVVKAAGSSLEKPQLGVRGCGVCKVKYSPYFKKMDDGITLCVD